MANRNDPLTSLGVRNATPPWLSSDPTGAVGPGGMDGYDPEEARLDLTWYIQSTTICQPSGFTGVLSDGMEVALHMADDECKHGLLPTDGPAAFERRGCTCWVDCQSNSSAV